MNAAAIDHSDLGKSAQMIALDWGTSSLRAYLLGEAGCVLAQVSTSYGIQHLPAPGGRLGFEQAFKSVAGAWLRQWPNLPVVACGMVGSQQGWCEVPYAHCPVDLRALVKDAQRVDTGLNCTVWIVPGARCESVGSPPDLMRGEETQIIGALLQQPQLNAGVTFVLPGTHSKWASIRDGQLVNFQTYMTGELYAMLRGYSTLGRLMPSGDQAAQGNEQSQLAAFKVGLDAARTNPLDALSHKLFGVRTLALMQRLTADVLSEYLSGLLIGHELLSGAVDTERPLVLVGDMALCQRYVSALKHLDMQVHALLDNTAAQGLWAFACAAELIVTTNIP
jgi:2-dehydro-3-deoxygalactonokinase